jgi:nitrate reductase delta subunit
VSRREHRTSHDTIAAAWRCAALLLDYPSGDDDLGPARAVVPRLPEVFSAPLARFLAYRDATPLGALQADYVDTFDSRRRCNLFLTYFAHGDTRKRGVALLRFKQTYLASGVQLTDDELPDHLCVVLEYAATIDLAAGRQLLLDHRAGLEMLRMSLHETTSPWAGLLDAVCAALPELRGDERDAVRRLAQAGPPAEEVGLSPYGTPQFDAAVTERRVDLPMPTVRGA